MNPWWWILLALGAYYVYNRYRHEIEARLAEWRQARQEAKDVADIKKNPDLYRER